MARGDEFSVTINNVGLADAFGEVMETLPAGFQLSRGLCQQRYGQCGD